MPETIATRLTRRKRPTPEPDEVAIVLTSDPGGAIDVPVAKTNVRTLAGAAKRGRQKGTAAAFGSTLGNMQTGRDRIGAYADARRLDRNIPEAGAALDIIASSAAGGEPGSEIIGFDVEYASEFPEVDVNFVDRLIDRTRARQLSKPLVRDSNRMGDVFFHVIVDNLGRIMKLRFLEPELTYIVLDEYGDHIGWEYLGYDDDERFLQLWEVMHVRHLPELGDHYGRSIFASGLRPTGFSLQGMRDSTTIQAVKNAAGQVAMIFGMPSTMPHEDRMLKLEEMYELTARAPVMDSDGKMDRRVIESMNDQPLILFYDVFPDGKGARPEIEELSPTRLEGMVAVLEHFQDLFVIPLKVPKAQLGIERSGEGIGGNRLDVQTVKFAEYLNSEQQDVVQWALDLIVLAYWLIGRPLKADMITIVMPDLTVLDTRIRTEIRKLAMEAASIAKSVGLPRSYIWTEIVWDGDTKTADAMAEKYGFDPEAEDEPAEPMDDDDDDDGDGDGEPEPEPEPPDADDVQEAKGRVARVLGKDLALIKQALVAISKVRGTNKSS